MESWGYCGKYQVLLKNWHIKFQKKKIIYSNKICFRYLSWLWLVFEKPAYHTCIETKELMFIETSLGEAQTTYITPTLKNTPWKSFFTSLPCYAIFVANFCRSWNFYLLVLFQASYFNDAFGSGLAEVHI